MKNLISLLIGLVILCLPLCIIAQDSQSDTNNSPRKFTHFDNNAPIGLSGDHFHAKGSWMLSYKFMPMWMEGTLSGSDDLSATDIHKSFMVAPLEMRMDMHMLSIMYAPSNRVTVMAMGNYLKNTMQMEMKSGMQFSTTSKGIGDLSLSALYAFIADEDQSLHALAGISIPIGSIEQRDQTPMSENALLAYPMQLGSGTWDPMVSATYALNKTNTQLGLQAKYLFRLGENDQSYTLGNIFRANAWLAYPISPIISIATRVEYLNIERMDGANPDFNPMMMPLFDASNSGRQQLSLSGACNLKFKGFKIGLEVGYPIYQNVTGIQMQNDIFGTIGMKYTIGKTPQSCH